MARGVDWDGFYAGGRHRVAWDLGGPSPELQALLQERELCRGPGRAALDLGCGSGHDAILLARAGYEAAGIDISRAALALAEQNAAQQGARVTFVLADVTHLPFPDASFDLLTDRGCLHHIDEAQRPAYAREVARLLRPGGGLFLRGCRTNQFPFTAIDEAAIARHFQPPVFTAGPLIPLALRTLGGTIPGGMCLIRRS